MHHCQCANCRPHAYPSAILAGGRASPLHCSIRFGDCAESVLVNGVEVKGRCVEALAGPDGWALLLEDCPGKGFHLCAFCRAGGVENLCSRLVYGNVEIALTRVLTAQWNDASMPTSR